MRSLVMSLWLSCALAPAGPAAQSAPQTGGQVPSTPPAAEASQDDPVVARLLGEVITERQVLETIEVISRRLQMNPQQMQQRDVALFKPALERLIGIVLLENEARVQAIEPDSARIEQTFQSIAGRFPSPEAFRNALDQQGTTEEDLRKQIEDSHRQQVLLERTLQGLPLPTDEEIGKFYDENPQHFEEPEEVHAAHILLKTDGENTPERNAEIRAKPERIRAEIESDALPFAEAAALHSEDTSNSRNGGDLGFFPRGRMVQAFEEAAFAAEAGTLTPVVESQFGYHLIKVLERKPAGRAALDDAKENIRNYLQQQSQQAAIAAYIAGLREKAQVETLMTEEEWIRRRSSN